MQRFFDLIATKFAASIEHAFTLLCDRMEQRLQHVEQETPALTNGKRKVVTVERK